MQTNSTYQTIPVTKNLSLKIEDIIGELKLDAETANAIVRYAEENLGVRLQVCVKEEAGVKKLSFVSFSLLPRVAGICSLAEKWFQDWEALCDNLCFDEAEKHENFGRRETLLACRRELLGKLNGK